MYVVCTVCNFEFQSDFFFVCCDVILHYSWWDLIISLSLLRVYLRHSLPYITWLIKAWRWSWTFLMNCGTRPVQKWQISKNRYVSDWKILEFRDGRRETDVSTRCRDPEAQMFRNTAPKRDSKHPCHVTKVIRSIGACHKCFETWHTCRFCIWLTGSETNHTIAHLSQPNSHKV